MRGRPGRRRCRARRPPARGTHAREVASRLGGASGREAVPDVAGQLGQPDERTLGQVAGEPGRGDQAPGPDASPGRLLRAVPPPAVASGARPRAGQPAARARDPAARPASACARRSRSAASASRRRPDRLEAVPLLGRRADRRGQRVGHRLGGPLELGRVAEPDRRSAPTQETSNAAAGRGAGWRSAGSATRSWRPGSPGRPAAWSRRPNSWTGMPSLPVAPVDEQGEHLATPEHAEDLAQVAPRDHPDAPRLALAAEQLVQLRERRVVGDDADRQPVVGDRRRRRPRCCRRGRPRGSARPGASSQIAPDLVGIEVRREHADLVGRHRRQAHQLDEVAAVFAVGAQGQRRTRGSSGGRPRTCAEVLVRPAPLGRPGAGTRPATGAR